MKLYYFFGGITLLGIAIVIGLRGNILLAISLIVNAIWTLLEGYRYDK